MTGQIRLVIGVAVVAMRLLLVVIPFRIHTIVLVEAVVVAEDAGAEVKVDFNVSVVTVAVSRVEVAVAVDITDKRQLIFAFVFH